MATTTELQRLLLTRDESCGLLGIKLSQYKVLVRQGLLHEISIGVRGKRLPYSEAQRYVRERLSETEAST
jgi:predicted site-specific integrase-resolvase